jgi:hypothetical protein
VSRHTVGSVVGELVIGARLKPGQFWPPDAPLQRWVSPCDPQWPLLLQVAASANFIGLALGLLWTTTDPAALIRPLPAAAARLHANEEILLEALSRRHSGTCPLHVGECDICHSPGRYGERGRCVLCGLCPYVCDNCGGLATLGTLLTNHLASAHRQEGLSL